MESVRRSRRFLVGLAVAALTACSGAAEPTPVAAPAVAGPSPSAAPEVLARDAEFAALEQEFDARLGVHVVDTGSGRSLAHRADERFAYASTIKALLVGVVLAQTEDAELDEVVAYTATDLVRSSPVTQERVVTGMTVRELCDAALRFSDNTAANLLLRTVGGPEGLDAALEGLGDDVTTVSRTEPDLNAAVPGDDRDTSTPRAMARSLRALAVGDALAAEERATLTAWLRGNTTGDTLVRAGVPAGWEVGDKTGSGGYGTRNDLAVLWPPGRAPLVLAVMSSRDEPDADRDDALIARATEVAVAALG